MEATGTPSPGPSTTSNPNAFNKIAGSRTSAASEAVAVLGNAAFKAASPRASYRHKENEHGVKQAVKIAMPSFSAVARGISATSKAASVSQRGKILAEKNLYLAKNSSRLDFGMEEAICACGHRSKEQRRALRLESKNPYCQADGLDSFSISLMAETPADADPSLSPYDPYANYLASRPRFLYYRPNAWVKRHLLDDSGLIDTENWEQLGDILSKENCEDTLEQFDEELPSDLPMEYKEESCCSEEVKFAGECTSYSESNHRPSNGRSLLLYALACIILVLVIACFSCFCAYFLVSFSISRTPLISAMNDLHLRDYIAGSVDNLTVLVKRMEHWSFNSFADYSILSNIPRERFGPLFLANLAASPVPQRLNIDYNSIAGTILSNKEITQENEMKKPPKKNMEEEYNIERNEADVSREELQVGLGFEAEKRSMDVIQDMEGNKRVAMQANSLSGLHKSLQGGFLKFETDNKIEEGGIEEIEWGRRIGDTESEKNAMVDLRKRQNFHDIVTECEITVNQDDSTCLHFSSQIHYFGLGNISLTSCHEGEPSGYVRSPEVSDYGVSDSGHRVIFFDGITKKNVQAEHMKRQDLVQNLVTDHVGVDQDDDNCIYSSSQIHSSGHSDASLASGHEHEIFNNIKSQEASIYGVNAFEQGEKIDSIASDKNVEAESRQKQDPHHLAALHLVVSDDDDDISLCSARQMQSSSGGNIPLASSQEHGTYAKYPVNLVMMGLLFSVFLLLVSSVIVYVMWNQTPKVGKLEITPSMQITDFFSASNEMERYNKAMKSPYQNTPVNMLVNSGPSDFSNCMSVNQQRTTEKQESRPRRVSALPSTPISYGSFITYEKISSKKGNRKEAATMPVRRSSRIRNQISSPRREDEEHF